MDKFDKSAYEIVRRLQNARLSLIKNHPFYAYLLLHMRFAVDLTCNTAYTDGTRIAFNPDFINELSDKELEFVLMHEVLHVVLEHPFRKQSDYELDVFDIACDIVVNSNILYSCNMDTKCITLDKYGESMHLMPNGEEGYLYDVNQVYDVLMAQKSKLSDSSDNNNDGSYAQSYEPSDTDASDSNSPDSHAENDKNSSENKAPSSADKSESNNRTVDKSSIGDDDISEDDINSMISDLLTRKVVPEEPECEHEKTNETRKGFVDDHTFWNGDDDDNTSKATWLKRMIEATELVKISNSGKCCGDIPLAAQRVIEEIMDGALDWRTILTDFVQEEICDYSFTPPDRRMQDCDFFLPDFNEKDDKVENVLFMVDTSASMSDKDITECYSEIYGAIMQFGGKLTGKLGFFDGVVVDPIPFENEDEFKIIRPVGGGGTNFFIIFDYVRRMMSDNPPVSIVILTDGYAPFPQESIAMGIPVLWVINNKEVDPPWGKVARILDNAP